jgi:hypothetical protein
LGHESDEQVDAAAVGLQFAKIFGVDFFQSLVQSLQPEDRQRLEGLFKVASGHRAFGRFLIFAFLVSEMYLNSLLQELQNQSQSQAGPARAQMQVPEFQDEYDPEYFARSPVYRPSSPPGVEYNFDRSALPVFTHIVPGHPVAVAGPAPAPEVTPAPIPTSSWTLSPENLLETLDRRLKPKRSESLLAACEDLAQGFGGILFVDASLLRLLPAGSVTEADGRGIVALVQAQVALLSQTRTPSSPLSRFVAPQFDPRRQGFVVSAGDCAQGGLAAVPFRLLRVNSRQQLVLGPETPPAPDQALAVRTSFLHQMATLCRSLGASDVPTLSAAAVRRDRSPDVVVSAKNGGVHPVLRVLATQPDRFGMSMSALRAEVDKSGSLAQFLARFQAWSTAQISLDTHTRWASGLCADLLAEAWPVKLELLEDAEVLAVVQASRRPERPEREDRRRKPHPHPHSYQPYSDSRGPPRRPRYGDREQREREPEY